MTYQSALAMRVPFVFVALTLLLAAGVAPGQEIRDLDTLSAESARAARLRHEGKPLEALPIAKRVAKAAEALYGPEPTYTVPALYQLALVHADLGQYPLAEQLQLRCLQICEAKLGREHLKVANCLSSLGLTYRSMGECAKALPLFQRSLQISVAKLGKDHLDVADCLYNMSLVYEDMGEYTKAEPLNQRSLQIFEAKLGENDPAVADAANSLGILHQAMGQYGKAETLYKRSQLIYEAKLGKDNPRVAHCLNNLGNLYFNMDEYAKAEPCYQRSLEIFEMRLGKDHPLVANSLNNLGLLSFAQGQYAKAELLYLRSLKIFETRLDTDHPIVADSLGALAVLYQDMGQSVKAGPLYKRCLEIREAKLGKEHPDVIHSQANLALFYERSGQTNQSAKFIDSARRGSGVYVARILPILSEKEQADFLCSRDAPAWRIALTLGLRHSDDPKLAELSASWLLNGKGITQQTLAQTALASRDSRDPRLSGLSQSLFRTRRELAHLTLNPPSGDQLQQRQRRLDELTDREQELAKQLRSAGGGSFNESWVELDKVRGSLPDGAVLINLARFGAFDFTAKRGQRQWQPAHYGAWIIPAKGPVRLVDLGPADAIETDIGTLLSALKDAPKTIRLKGEAESEKLLRVPLESLAKKVLHPLLPYIGKSKNWIISPDGNLWLTPWAALPLPDGTYAVEEHTVSYVISGRELVDAPPSIAKPGAPLILANPDFDLGLDKAALETRRLLHQQERPTDTRGASRSLRLGNVPRLPGTAAEAVAIAPNLKRYAGVAPRVYTDHEALTGVFQTANRPKLLVLSTHGYFLPDQDTDPTEKERLVEMDAAPRGLNLENPLLRCGLLLAGCNNADKAKVGDDNGVLTGLQIVGADLRGTELVVLSACETGLGDVRNGEGVAGLRQAFQLAGAQSVVATLWQVPDQSSAQLMIGFFDNLAEKRSKAEALRNAQLTLIQARRDKTAAAHPYYWAAYTVTGR